MDKLDPLLSFKVILMGDSGVGKTSLANRQAYKQFSNQLQPTIGTGIFKVVVPVGNFKVELNIWDTAGQDKFKSVIPMYMRDTIVCVLVAAIDSQLTIEHLDEWKALVEKDYSATVCMVAINKTDLQGTPGAKTIEDLRESLMDKYPSIHFVSAKSNTGVEELFSAVATECLNYQGSTRNNHHKMDLSHDSESSGSSCC